MNAPLPAAIGRYVVEAAIGRGAMGVIYRGHDPVIDRIVAIKVVAADVLASEEAAGFLERFRREAQAAARCVHPGIVTVHDYGVDAGRPYIVMEHVAGASLRERLAAGQRFAPEEAATLVLRVLGALQAAHAAGVVHRDIKPANILIAQDGRVKVADFGISRVGEAGLTAIGDLLGTPGYMSPEQSEGLEADARSDLFSTSVILYELLTGQRAFPARGFAEIRRHLLQEPPPRLPPDLAGALGEGMVALLDCGLARERERRFPSAAAMAAALRAAMPAAEVEPAELATVLLQPRPVLPEAGGTGGTGSFTSEFLRALEAALRRSLGPVARVLVRRAAATAPTTEALVAALAAEIPEPEARRSFMQEARQAPGATAWEQGGAGSAGSAGRAASGAGSAGGSAASGTGRIAAAELARVEQALARQLGPIARILVRRAAATAPDAEALWRALAEEIPDARERARFLAARDR